MGLFKKSYIDRIKQISARLNEINLSEDDLILNFKSKVKEIEQEDIELIKLLKELSRKGHLSERMKRSLLNQLLFLLRRLEKLKFEDKEKLNEVKAEINGFLELELTTERIGIEVNKILYHGSGLSGIKSFELDIGDFDYLGSATLGSGINCTDNKKMAINYAFYRYEKYMKNDELKAKYRNRLGATVYILKPKKGKNYFADLSDPIKIKSIYKDLAEYFLNEAKKPAHASTNMLKNFGNYLMYRIIPS